MAVLLHELEDLLLVAGTLLVGSLLRLHRLFVRELRILARGTEALSELDERVSYGLGVAAVLDE